jgi:hypothetical protein
MALGRNMALGHMALGRNMALGRTTLGGMAKGRTAGRIYLLTALGCMALAPRRQARSEAYMNDKNYDEAVNDLRGALVRPLGAAAADMIRSMQRTTSVERRGWAARHCLQRTCDMASDATYNMQHATCTMHHEACRMQHAISNVQHAA